MKLNAAAKLGLILATVSLASSLSPAGAATENFRYVGSGLPAGFCFVDAGDPELGGSLTTGSACPTVGPGNNVTVRVTDDVWSNAGLPLGFIVRAQRPYVTPGPGGPGDAGNPACGTSTTACTIQEWAGCGAIGGLVMPGGTYRLFVRPDSLSEVADLRCGAPAFGTTGVISVDIS